VHAKLVRQLTSVNEPERRRSISLEQLDCAASYGLDILGA
jgi:hypothetical protein